MGSISSGRIDGKLAIGRETAGTVYNRTDGVRNMRTVDDYLKKGFNQKTAEYFASGRRKIIEAVPEDNYTLRLCFDNQEHRLLDIKPLIQPGTVFSFLEDEGNFRRVYLDENSNVAWDIDPQVDSQEVWNNKVDLSSDTCYLDSIPVSG